LAYKTIWISTPPRTGSTWLFNVAREILRLAGFTTLPKRPPQQVHEMLEIARREAWPDNDPSRVWVLKIHGLLLRRDIPQSRIITSLRDPRDVLVSFMRFMNTSFEHALETSAGVMRYAEAYRDFPPELMLIVDYADIEARPATVAMTVARFLDAPLAPVDAQRIVERYSRERVRELTEQTTRSLQEKLAAGIAIPRDEVVLRDEKVERAFDVTTGFQTGHITSAIPGEWRKLLSAEQKRRVSERFGDWLERHGFPPR